ncbi:MAG: hypothetical protein M0R46_03670 [Candidatus Muirbacterium halophilum]|nr:hypothetical protein [Candidatus Muirbacterium halophilum]MCK9474989.1 hypothetical protein [Candidatus Muirbacterium halophilum]
MKKAFIIIVILLSEYYFLFSYENNFELNKEKLTQKQIKIISIRNHNTQVYYELLKDMVNLTTNIVSGNYSLKEKKEFKKIFDSKKKLFFFVSKQIRPSNNNNDIKQDSNLKCATCNGKGCEICGWDGWGYTSADNPKKCGRCDGTGSFSGRICKGCNGLGWANSSAN